MPAMHRDAKWRGSRAFLRRLALRLHIPFIYLDVQLESDGELEEFIPEGYRGLVYVVDGTCEINGEAIEQGTALFIEDPGAVAILSDAQCR